MPSPESNAEELIVLAAGGDQEAMGRLFDRHRARLKRMVAVRLDPRIRARLDPSDVVQEVLMEAAERLPAYARNPPLPFYPWLRGIAWQRLVDLYRRHLMAGKRSLRREEPLDMQLSDASATHLLERLASSGTSPSRRMLREEMCQRVRTALERLPAPDREVLVLRHLEQLTVSEIAVILGIDEGAVKMRRLRAARRLRDLLGPFLT
jgi:RNA polymerase sigma-70 factor, ECF subfamily